MPEYICFILQKPSTRQLTGVAVVFLLILATIRCIFDDNFTDIFIIIFP